VNTDARKTDQGPWRRPEPTALGPDRSFGGYYRTSDRKLQGKDLRGVPLQTAEDTVVAAVRMGYQVVDAQIERGLDMARRLQGAADRAGAGKPADMLDQAERLVSRGLLLGLEFLESAAAEPKNPIMRLLAAQYRLLGSVLGLTTDAAPPSETQRARRAPEEAGRPAPAVAESRQQPKGSRKAKIRHTPDSSKRAVTILRLELDPDVPRSSSVHRLAFHSVSGASNQQIDGTLRLPPDGPDMLEVNTSSEHAPGYWRAAVCDDDGEQLGIVEIEL
jgi:hypothetical protein